MDIALAITITTLVVTLVSGLADMPAAMHVATRLYPFKKNLKFRLDSAETLFGPRERSNTGSAQIAAVL